MTKSLSQPDDRLTRSQSAFATVALFIILCVIALRPLVSESYDASPSSISQAISQVSDPSPLRTIIFDLSILLATLLWLIGRTLSRLTYFQNEPQASAHADANEFFDSQAGKNYRKTGLEWGLLLLTIAGVISCCFAGNKRLAITATVDWLCLPVMTIALVNLLRTSGQRQLLLAVIIASACAQSAQCLEQSLVGNADSWAHYESIKELFWAAQGISPDNPTITLFENRIKANEAQGFLPHSNVTGSYLVFALFLAMGSLWQRWRNGGFTYAPLRSFGLILLTAAIGAGVVTTRSLGAYLSAVVSLLLLAALTRWSKFISANKIKVLWASWLGFIVAIIATVGHGLYHNSFPHMSLTFRWQYWKASAKLICDYFLTGVGRENFGRHYLQYKSIQSPEEISNPHNLFVQATSEWGILGLAGILAMLIGVTYLIARYRKPQSITTPSAQQKSPNRWWLWGIGLSLVVAIIRIPLLGTTDLNFIYYTTVITTASWLLGFTCMAYMTSPVNTDSSENRYIIAATLAGLFAFLLHDMINFAMFVPASATTFFAALALIIPDSRDIKHTTPKAHQYHWFWPIANLAALGAVCGLAFIPSYQSYKCLKILTPIKQQAALVRDDEKPPYKNIPQACYADTLDPSPIFELANLWILASVERDKPAGYLRKANDALREAKVRDPYDIRLQRLIANVSIEQARTDDSMHAYLAAARAARAAIELYPDDPNGLIDAAKIESEVATVLQEMSIMQDAINHYTQALSLDDARPQWEQIRKLSEQKRANVTNEIQRLKNELRAE